MGFYPQCQNCGKENPQSFFENNLPQFRFYCTGCRNINEGGFHLEPPELEYNKCYKPKPTRIIYYEISSRLNNLI